MTKTDTHRITPHSKYPIYEIWRGEFIRVMVECGIPEPQADRYRWEFAADARQHYQNGLTPHEAAAKEIMG